MFSLFKVRVSVQGTVQWAAVGGLSLAVWLSALCALLNPTFDVGLTACFIELQPLRAASSVWSVSLAQLRFLLYISGLWSCIIFHLHRMR